MGDISSGAAGDIKHVTKLARHMVCDWGMSPLGPISFGDNQDTVFLGRDITRNDHMSEETARRVDAEVQRIISEQLTRARQILGDRRDTLDRIAQALLEYETIEGKHVHEIMEFGEIRSQVLRVSPPAGETATTPSTADKSATTPPLGQAPSPNPA